MGRGSQIEDRLIAHISKVANSSLSRLVASFQVFRRLMKGKFDAYVLWLLTKKFQNWIVDRSTARDFTVWHCFFHKKRAPECKPEWIREAKTVFSRLPSLMAADKPCPQLQPSLMVSGDVIYGGLFQQRVERGGGVLSHGQRDNFIDALNQNTKIMNYRTQNTYYLRPQALAY